MKLFITFCIFFTVLFGGQLSYEHSYKAAVQKASKEKKKLMMIYSAPWCPECSYMKDVAFNKPQLNRYLQNNFVLLDLNVDKDDLPKGFDYVGIPTFFILDSSGKRVGKLVGGDKSLKFLERLKVIK